MNGRFHHLNIDEIGEVEEFAIFSTLLHLHTISIVKCVAESGRKLNDLLLNYQLQ